ncbi:MAG: XdhC family protein [Armatimonadota bacterium]|nr:XdhC family protein [Armatimonadota bacterium]MDR7532700.1 XdhC family protein [Armatimonadota bacterium]MDR7536351.1 XdhC family protein [Armatimonadota bacterium]
MRGDLLDRAQALRASGEPFVLATVVRIERPASARPGMKAILTADGRLEGWVGGSCAHTVVVREGLHLLHSGRAGLLRLSPTAAGRLEREGVIEQPMTCHSGGTLEIYLEPVLPPPRLVVVGDAPLADALAALGRLTGFDVWRVRAGKDDAVGADDRTLALHEFQEGLVVGAYVVVASMGQYDEDVLARVLGAGAAYVGLVASPKRAMAVRRDLARRGADPVGVDALRAPAGLDIGAVTPEEIAVSIVAEVIGAYRARREVGAPGGHEAAGDAPPAPGLRAVPAAAAPDTAVTVDASAAEAVDPVCGMTVAVAGAVHTLEHGGVRVYFCCAHCRQTFAADPARYLMVGS